MTPIICKDPVPFPPPVGSGFGNFLMGWSVVELLCVSKRSFFPTGCLRSRLGRPVVFPGRCGCVGGGCLMVVEDFFGGIFVQSVFRCEDGGFVDERYPEGQARQVEHGLGFYPLGIQRIYRCGSRKPPLHPFPWLDLSRVFHLFVFSATWSFSRPQCRQQAPCPSLPPPLPPRARSHFPGHIGLEPRRIGLPLVFVFCLTPTLSCLRGVIPLYSLATRSRLFRWYV